MASLKKDSLWFKQELTHIEPDFFCPIAPSVDFNLLFNNLTPHYKRNLNKALKNSKEIKRGYLYLSENVPNYKLETPISWGNKLGKDRNTRLLFQSLSFLDYVLIAYKHNRDKWYLNFIKQTCTSWWHDSFTKREGDHQMAWHDHVITIRLNKFLKILVILQQEEKKDPYFLKILYQAIYIHARILDEDESIKFYNHNHGLEQAYNLYLVSILIKTKKKIFKSQLEKRNLMWLQKELRNLISPEGVQTENSPSYHGRYCSEAYRINNVLTTTTKQRIFSKELENKSLEFLIHMTQPDGHLVPLGDTQEKLRPNARSFWNISELPSYPSYQYLVTKGQQGLKPQKTMGYWKKSGYFTLRDKWDKPGENTACHLSIKCGFLSIGHRHDDDGQILLYAYGEPWLIDAGSYSYSHDHIREFVLSPEAHNISSPSGLKIRQKGKLLALPKNRPSLNYSNSKLECISYMFPGYKYQRSLQIKTPTQFTLSDQVDLTDLSARYEHINQRRHYISRFRFPFDKKIQIKDNSLLISSTKTEAQLTIMIKSKVKEIKIIKENTPRLQPSKTICLFFGSSWRTKNSLALDFDLQRALI